MTRGQALVVGASSEIGTAIASALVPYADRLVLWGRDGTRLSRAAAACRDAREEFHVATRSVDVTDSAQLADGVAALRADGPVTIVVWTPGLFDWALADEADPALAAGRRGQRDGAAGVHPLGAAGPGRGGALDPDLPGLGRRPRHLPEQRGLRRQQARPGRPGRRDVRRRPPAPGQGEP